MRYFQYNELGTVLAQTDGNGDWEGTWEPDHYGNYRYVYPGSPARPELGLTGQFFDNISGTYKFRYRDLDPERGRWLSRDPLGFVDGPNVYTFTVNDPVNFNDSTGLSISDFSLCMTACYLGFSSISELKTLWTGMTDPRALSRAERRRIELEIRKQLTGSRARPTDMDELIKERTGKKLKNMCQRKLGVKAAKVFGPNVVPSLGTLVSLAMGAAEVWKVGGCVWACSRGTFPM